MNRLPPSCAGASGEFRQLLVSARGNYETFLLLIGYKRIGNIGSILSSNPPAPGDGATSLGQPFKTQTKKPPSQKMEREREREREVISNYQHS